MTENNPQADNTTQGVASASQTPPLKRRYEAPRIISTEPLEVAAGLCTGVGGYGKGPPSCLPTRHGS